MRQWAASGGASRARCATALTVFALYVVLVVVGLTGHGPLAGIRLGPFGGGARHGAAGAADHATTAGSSHGTPAPIELESFVRNTRVSVAGAGATSTAAPTGTGPAPLPSEPVTAPNLSPPGRVAADRDAGGSGADRARQVRFRARAQQDGVEHPGEICFRTRPEQDDHDRQARRRAGQDKASAPASKAPPATSRDPKRVAEP